MERVENHMVVNWWWSKTPLETEEKLNSLGRKEIKTGIFVAKEDEYDYALERLSEDENLRQEFVEWFYSGNWVKED